MAGTFGGRGRKLQSYIVPWLLGCHFCSYICYCCCCCWCCTGSHISMCGYDTFDSLWIYPWIFLKFDLSIFASYFCLNETKLSLANDTVLSKKKHPWLLFLKCHLCHRFGDQLYKVYMSLFYVLTSLITQQACAVENLHPLREEVQEVDGSY